MFFTFYENILAHGSGLPYFPYHNGCSVRHFIELDMITEGSIWTDLNVPSRWSLAILWSIHLVTMVWTCRPPGSSPFIECL